MRSLSSSCHQHLSDVVFCFLYTAFKVDLLLLENKDIVSLWTPLKTMHTRLCDYTSSSLTFSSAVFCASVRWLLISSFDRRMNLNNTSFSVTFGALFAQTLCQLLSTLGVLETHIRPTPSYSRVLSGSEAISVWVSRACFWTLLSWSICRSANLAFCCVSITFACSSVKAYKNICKYITLLRMTTWI